MSWIEEDWIDEEETAAICDMIGDVLSGEGSDQLDVSIVRDALILADHDQHTETDQKKGFSENKPRTWFQNPASDLQIDSPQCGSPPAYAHR